MISERCGYTLLEALIGMSIFVGILLPLTLTIAKSIQYNQGMDRFTAVCLIEQESLLIRTTEQEHVLDKKRIINNTPWIIRSEHHGYPLTKCIITIYKNKSIIDKAYFYFYKHRS